MRRSFRCAVLGCFFGLVGVAVAPAQTAKDAEKAFRDSLLKRQVYPRGYSADARIQWRWNGSKLVMDEPAVRTLGVVTVTSVKVKPDSVEIKGERGTLLRTGTVGFVLKGAVPVTLQVDLAGASLASILPDLTSLLFFANKEQAIANVPEAYQVEVPAQAADDNGAKPSRTKHCDCADREACTKDGTSQASLGLAPPVLKSSVEAGYSEEASILKISTLAKVAFTITASGKAVGLRLARPGLWTGRKRRERGAPIYLHSSNLPRQTRFCTDAD